MRLSLIDSIWNVIFWNLIIVLRIVGVTMSLYPARCSVLHLFRWDVNLILRGTWKPSNDKDGFSYHLCFLPSWHIFPLPIVWVIHPVSNDRINAKSWRRVVDMGVSYWSGLGKIPIISLDHHHRRYPTYASRFRSQIVSSPDRFTTVQRDTW